MAISDIFEATICCTCGGCCSGNLLCENCRKETLRANGLSDTLEPELRGLSHVWNGDGRSFEYSPLYEKLKELGNKQQ